MSCSTSFFNKAAMVLAILAAAVTCGCGRFHSGDPGLFSAVTGRGEGPTAVLSEEASPAEGAPVMVLPIENLSDTRAPVEEIRTILKVRMLDQGFRIIDDETLEQFREKHRMRYTGGVGTEISRAIQEETGAAGILITSLEAYYDGVPPTISIISRLVSSGSDPRILWIDSVGLNGDESPGLLGLTRITDIEPLTQKAVSELVGSLAGKLDVRSLAAHDSEQNGVPAVYRWKRKYLPYDYFRSPIIDPETDYSIAVIPMLNLGVRKNAGNIVSLHYVRELHQLTDYRVVEPGVVREELLRFRAIMPAGPSLAITDLITSAGSLGTDLVLTGRVFSYQDEGIAPKADFSVQVIENRSREIVFGARTFSTGDEGVWFFNVGRVFTAHRLVEEMTEMTTMLLSARTLPPEIPEEDIIAYVPAEALHDGEFSARVQQARKKDRHHPFVIGLAQVPERLMEF